MNQHKPKTTVSVSEMTPDEREEETVRRYQEAIDTAKSGVIKKKTPHKEAEVKPGSDETIPGS